MSDPGFSPESGRRADPDRPIEVIQRVLARHDADGDGPPLELDWSNKQDRQWVHSVAGSYTRLELARVQLRRSVHLDA